MDKFRKGGGGFLNNVDGEVVDLIFTDNPDFGAKAPERKEGDFTALWGALTVQQDGSEEPDTTHLFAGSADDFVITEDGHGLQPVDGAELWGSTPFYRLYSSMVEHGLDDVEPAEDGTLDFSHIAGHRYRFVQVRDEEAMARTAKTYRKSRGKINEKGQRKGKDGKYYDLRALEVSEVYDGDAPAPKAARTARPVVGKATAPVKPAARGKAPARGNGEADIAEFAKATLLDILGSAKGNTISKSGLNLAITRKLVKDARRDDVRRYLYDDSALEAIEADGEIEYDKSGKAQTITLVT